MATTAYGVFVTDGRLVGALGLHRRVGPGALEIGYWVHVDHTRRGIATASARRPHRCRVRPVRYPADGDPLRCRQLASAAVPAKLGYRLVGSEDHEPEAPGEEGRRLVWVVYEREWKTAGC